MVVGAGAAGTGAAAALIARGLDVTILDVGKTLEPPMAERIARMSRLDSRAWEASDVAAVRVTPRVVDGIPKKLIFGSEYVYGSPDDGLIAAQSNFGGVYSLAFGGLTNVWGSAMLPFRSEDIAEWPITARELDEHYRAILAFVPSSGDCDALDALFPWFTESRTALALSPQLADFHDHVASHRETLSRAGIVCGGSRLAFRAETPASSTGCQRCGLCFYGCPYGVIYSTQFTIASWIEAGRCRYLGGLRLEEFREEGHAVTLTVRDCKDGSTRAITCDRVYLACGILPTAQVVLASTMGGSRTLVAKDSQAFLLPFFKFGTTADLRQSTHQNMSQAFVEQIDDRGLATHLQLYPYLDAVDDTLAKVIPRGVLRSKLFSRYALSHILVMQGFLHSEYSGTVEISNGVSSAPGGLHVVGRSNPHARRKLRRVLGALRGAARQLGGFPLDSAMRVFKPAASHHWGSTFPMKASPRTLECDAEGRLFGFGRVRIVDASVFPSIPATTIALSVMANAHRIASFD